MSQREEGADELKIGDLVEKVKGPRQGTLAIITGICLENYYEFNPWIRIAYVDHAGGYEWVHQKGLKILLDK